LGDIQYVEKDFHDSVWARCQPQYGDVLLVKDGVKTGTVALNTLREPFTLLSSVALIKTKPTVLSPRFLKYYLESAVGNRSIVGGMGGTAIKRIILKRIRQTSVPVPPMDEQQQIVAKIDELFSDVDAGNVALADAERGVVACRQATLNALVLGSLNDPSFARRSENGKPVLPSGWRWTTLGEISEMVQYGTGDKAQVQKTDVPVLRIGNIKSGRVITDDLKYMPVAWGDLDAYLLRDGDLLFIRTNGSRSLVGTAALFKGGPRNAVFASYLIRARLNPQVAVPEFALYCLNSAFGRGYIASVVSQVGQANVNGAKLKAFPIPLPPLEEQLRLVAEADEMLTQLDALAREVRETARESEQLRQSILAAAFSGQLI
jgi:type I restriction enzyme S subunit